LERDLGLQLPRGLQLEFREAVQRFTDRSGRELEAAALTELFAEEYLSRPHLALLSHRTTPARNDQVSLSAVLRDGEATRTAAGQGNGPIDAFVEALRQECGIELQVLDYHEHAVGRGAGAEAVAYVQVECGGASTWGVGRHRSIVTASLEAVTSAANRLRARERRAA
ncbi:MAG: 2-isopropylmalate synthase, partial [Deltaproteobacteria bacterium]|nr:2-isopropylmalate synthase [Deltaproteobacteria bacterium]